MKRQIKYRQAHYFDEGLTKFSHFTYWGFGLDGEVFRSPSSNNYAQYSIHDQFTGLTDKNKDIYEGDIVRKTESWQMNGRTRKSANVGTKYNLYIYFKDGCFRLMKIGKSKRFVLTGLVVRQNGLEVIGNLHENPELL